MRENKLNAAWDLFFEQPVYRDLSLDVKASRTPLPALLSHQVKVLELYFELLLRHCYNCGCYFSLTAGYNTCYCNRVAPGETERTCRKVGAHRKANLPTGLSPAGMEYRKTFNRLRVRKQRGKISKDEWNAAVAKAQKLVGQTGCS